MAHEFFEHLKEDHEELKSIGEQLLKASGSSQREDLLSQLQETFEPHAAGEEASLYKWMSSQQGEMREMSLKATQEHQSARNMIKELMKADTGSETFKAKASVLIDSKNHHIQEEENKVFPKVEQMLESSKIDDLYEQYQEAEEEAESKV